MSRKKEMISLAIGFLGVMLCLFGVVSFSKYILMSLPLVLRMVMMIVIYWILAVIPFIIMLRDKKSLSDYGFFRVHLFKQVMIGLALGVAMSLVFTLVPHLLGFGTYVDNGKRYKYLWQFIYEFVYCIIAVGFTEEFVFRGFLFTKFKSVFDTETAAVIGSSVLFGLFHIFGGNIVQIVITGLLGALFCLCRKKIKGCSTLSLIIMHGIYDALITVWASCLS